jgi:hypothetical protein
MRRPSTVLALPFAAYALLLLSGCPDKEPKNPPTIISFTASSTSLAPGGGEVTFAWVQADGKELYIDNGVGSVKGKSSASAFVATTTTFTLTATNKLGSVQKSVTVEVRPATEPPTVTGFTATPWQLQPRGGEATLRFSVNNAESLFIDNGVGNVTGKSSAKVSLTRTTTFTLTARNHLGEATKQTTVEVIVPTEVPEVNFFSVNPNDLPLNGGTVKLSWDVTGFTNLSVDNGVGDVTDKSEVSLRVAETTTFTLTASNNIGTATAKATVSVYVPSAPPSLSFSADRTSLPSGGGRVRLSWQATDAQTLSIDNGVGNVLGRSYVDVNVYRTTAFKITATNVRGSREQIVLVQVPTDSLPVIAYFDVDKTYVSRGETVRLRWSASNYDDLYLNEGLGNVEFKWGNYMDVTINGTVTLTLTARTDEGQVATRSVTIYVF